MCMYEFVKINKEEYNELYELASSKKLLFASPKYIKICEEYYPEIDYSLHKIEKLNKVIAILPIIKSKKYLATIYTSPMPGMMGPYLGPVFINDMSNDEKLEIINLIMMKAGVLYFDMSLPPESIKTSGNIFSDGFSKFVELGSKTNIIDLSVGVEDVWNNMVGRARTAIRKAIKNDIVVEVDSEMNWIKDFSSMYSNMWSSIGISNYEKQEFFEALNNAYAQSDSLICACAKKDDNVLGYNIFLVDSSTMHCIAMVANHEGKKYAVHSIMWWECMKKAIQMGVKELDVGGTNNLSIAKFKKSFGGREVVSKRYKRIHILFWPLYKMLIWLKRK